MDLILLTRKERKSNSAIQGHQCRVFDRRLVCCQRCQQQRSSQIRRFVKVKTAKIVRENIRIRRKEISRRAIKKKRVLDARSSSVGERVVLAGESVVCYRVKIVCWFIFIGFLPSTSLYGAELHECANCVYVIKCSVNSKWMLVNPPPPLASAPLRTGLKCRKAKIVHDAVSHF